VVNERDEFGSDLVPDYLGSLRDGGFYGWPYSYWPASRRACSAAAARARGPGDRARLRTGCAQTAPLGQALSSGGALHSKFAGGMFVGLHGSWNRRPHSGYRVIFVPFENGKPSAKPVDVLTGFLNTQGDALGRPVGVVLERHGALLVADDVGNMIWRVSALR
jgi:glucose/arabinose dehydrogenase